MYQQVNVPVAIGGKESVSVMLDAARGKSDPRPVCFVMGLSSHYHDKFSDSFRRFFRLVLLDLYWTDSTYSQEFVAALTLAKMAEHVEQVRQGMERQLGPHYRQVLLLGHSAFGFICLEYALRYPGALLGIINICSPLSFDEEQLQVLQKEYMDSNYGPKAPGGESKRWTDYRRLENAYQQEVAGKPVVAADKQEFLNWYLSMGPMLWCQSMLWQNEDGEAAKIWEPWQIAVCATAESAARTVCRDVNMTMYARYFALAADADYRGRTQDIRVPILWFIGLHDARINLFLFKSRWEQANPQVDLYRVEAAHWPMCDGNVAEFDTKAISWFKDNAVKDQEEDAKIDIRAGGAGQAARL